ncbi:MAG TPA: hypothetical protein V6C81_26375 [Planktothrix sp.]|jgi:hypothetical protein
MFESSVQSQTQELAGRRANETGTTDTAARLREEAHDSTPHFAEFAGLAVLLGATLLTKGRFLAEERYIPQLDEAGRLPPGRYQVGFEEFEARFITNDRRRWLGNGMIRALHELKDAGATRVEIGGSFVSAKPNPKDFDMAWLNKSIKEHRFSDGMYTPRLEFGGEIWGPDKKFLGVLPERDKIVGVRDLLSRDREGNRFGTIVLDLTKRLPPAPPRGLGGYTANPFLDM